MVGEKDQVNFRMFLAAEIACRGLLWCASPSHHYFCTDANLGWAKKKRTCSCCVQQHY
ncbi:hypothetical protein PISMIDRAFT_223897 [Pisolithus microcarpus 441]|uniref:Uncharacterized protein n=1 Tax=Pisolithus microcarpus 441 TaxID=765257 RepID=A0A0C9YU67_9AGAM|nr:hypothetical protein PISMIDRAFT_223897 [Pisolithus microcarpus 441]